MNCPNHPERLAAKALGYCGDCLIQDNGTLSQALGVHARFREMKGLVERIPNGGQLVCPDCGNHCKLEEGQIGFCHNRHASKTEVVRRYGEAVPVSWYFDPLPTNCVADWVCPVKRLHESGLSSSRLKNLAVFYGSCNSDCLFCQNSSCQDMMMSGSPLMTPQELAGVADEKTACVCYFGGDPAFNPMHSLEASELLYEKWKIPVCYETNGNISGKWINRIAGIVKESGGTLKFDLKTMTPELYQALTGIRNNMALKNFRRLGNLGKEREGEFLVASILLIPGYIGLKEIERLCSFIVSCDSSIPTALLGFFPHHHMTDLPRTSQRHATDAARVAKECGLENVRIGNTGLLGGAVYRYD